MQILLHQPRMARIMYISAAALLEVTQQAGAAADALVSVGISHS
jgi:hypothetical protein